MKAAESGASWEDFVRGLVREPGWSRVELGLP